MPGLHQQLAVIEAAGLTTLAQSQPELIYSFRHALIQEAAYQSLTKSQRLRLHGTIGDVLEAVYATRLAEFAGVLAYHFAQARQLDKAVAYALQAARRAVALHAHDEAHEVLRVALALFDPADVSLGHLAVLEDLADVLSLLREGRRAVPLYQQALGIWDKLAGHDPLVAVRLHRKIMQAVAELRGAVAVPEYALLEAAVDASRASLLAGLELSETLPPHAEIARLLMALATHAWNVQTPPDWDAALRYAQAATQIAEQLPDPVEFSAALGTFATAQFGKGQLSEYRRVALRRLALCRVQPSDYVREKVDALRDAGSALMYTGEYQRALDVLAEAEGLARQIHAVDQEFNVLILQSQCWLRLDRWDEVLRIEAEWTNLEQRFGRERLGLTCFAVALGAVARALRGELDLARSGRQASYAAMLAFTGPPAEWTRNQHY